MLANRMMMCQNKRKIDRSVPTTVVASVYSSSAYARPQRLSNGWLVSAVLNESTYYIYFYVSKDNGATWQQLCYIFATYAITKNAFTMCSIGTKIYVIFQLSGSGVQTRAINFDAVTQTNVNVAAKNYFILDEAYTNGEGCSIACDSSGILHAVWSGKTATYSGGYNLRYSKSVDGGMTWDATIHLTTYGDSSTHYAIQPCVVIRNDGNPSVIYVRRYSNYAITVKNYNGVSWGSEVFIYSGSTYSQRYPSAVVSLDGSIHVAWEGLDSANRGVYHIRYSKSTDNGTAWSAMLKLMSGNNYSRTYPTISVNKNNNIFIIFELWEPNHKIQEVIYDGTAWGSIIDLTDSLGSRTNPSSCDNYTDFEQPLTIWKDSLDSKVVFRGVWNE